MNKTIWTCLKTISTAPCIRPRGLGLELVVYILTMAKLELANEVGDQRLIAGL